jgi:Cu(I)/Ag(I) efflux system periplasmic protein CusF
MMCYHEEENNITRYSILIAVSMFGTGLAFQASADDRHHPQTETTAVAAAVSNAALAEGEVHKVDKAAGKITIKHGPIRNLDMPPMTMAYRVKDQAMLDQLKPGDKITFEASNIGGAFTLVRFEKMK